MLQSRDGSRMESLGQLKTLVSVDNKFVKDWKSRNKPVLGYAASYTPEEVIYAGGILPVRVFGRLEPSKLADVYLPVNVCSFAKSCFNRALKGELSFLDGYVASNTCDNQNKIYDFWRHRTSIPKTYFINTPHSTSENALKFFHKELERFKEWLMKSFGVEISEKSLKDAIKTFNENRKLLKQVYALRKPNPPLVSGSETLEIVLSSMTTPKDEHNKLLRILLDEIPRRKDPPKKGVRILVSGSIMSDSAPIKLIESVGGSVVADDLCTGSRYFWNTIEENGEPMRAIAEGYLRKVPCPFMSSYEERFKHVKEMAKRFDAKGVVIFISKFCDVHSFEAPLLAEELRENGGLPVSCLEWDHTLTGVAQLKTRIEAFIEMLEE